MQLSVVIPMYNEAANVDPLLAEIDTAFGDAQLEVICVDDGSTDDTVAYLTAAQKRYRWLRVLRHGARSGQSSALRSGIRAARSALVATLDGDGQNDPNDLPRLLAAFEQLPANAPRLAIGWRRQRHDAWLRRVSSRVANRVRNRVLGDSCPDSGCGARIIDRQTFLDLPFFDHMHRFLPALVTHAGGNIAVMELAHRPRLRGRSKYGTHDRLWAGIVDLVGVLWLRRRTRRIVVEENAGND